MSREVTRVWPVVIRISVLSLPRYTDILTLKRHIDSRHITSETGLDGHPAVAGCPISSATLKIAQKHSLYATRS